MSVKTTQAFGLKTKFDTAELILIPAPWEATTSYQPGTSQGPDLIRKASSQLDFFNLYLKKSYNHKIHFKQLNSKIKSLNKKTKIKVQKIQKSWYEEKKTSNKKELLLIKEINQACKQALDSLYEECAKSFDKGQIPALVGGEHSVSEAPIRLIGEHYSKDYGILHIDAHADLRPAYQGLRYSHASIMYNVINSFYSPRKLIQVGIRDLCEEEYKTIKKDSRIHCFFDKDLASRLFHGESWFLVCQEIIKKLPKNIYVSLDVDGLSQSYCPGTGTPVPGGLSYNQILFLLAEIKKQNKILIAFDVVESSPGFPKTPLSEWNGNVSARLIYHLAGLALETQKKLK